MQINGISITVCSYNDGKLLPHFFTSFLEQVPVDFRIELNVIDNGSIDNTKQVVEQFALKFANTPFGFNYFYEAERGLNHARNRGIK